MLKSGSDKRLYAGRQITTLVFLLMVVIFLMGCSAAYRIKVLSFFFDGVPNLRNDVAVQLPYSLKRGDTVLIAEAVTPEAAGPKMNIHSPYLDKECFVCHDKNSMGSFTNTQPNLCYQCHDDFANKYKSLHGPVSSGECTQCHNPHLSTNSTLLKRTNRSICSYCHEIEVVIKSEAHLGISDANCTDCHNPHGGEDRYILR